MPPKFRGASVLIGIIANDAARFSEFSACVTNLEVPPGHRIEWVIGGDWCGARNSLARLCLEEGYTHLWFMDDDHAFAPDILTKLLRHNVPLVNPMCFTRTWPFQPVTYLEDGALDLASVPDRGLVELHAGGAAGMLIAREVLEAISDPWFEYSDRSEDVIFCEKAKEAGFTLYGDLEARLGHITTAVVWPSFNPEHGWMTGLTIGKDMQVQIPLTADLVNHEIHRIEVPFDQEDAAERIGTEIEAELVEMLPPEGPVDHQIYSDRRDMQACMMCGATATWHDAWDQWGCAEHMPNHELWRQYYERAELWYVQQENRWYYRVLRGDGTVALKRDVVREQVAIDEIADSWPGMLIHHVADELSTSRQTSGSSPRRQIWAIEPEED